MASTGILIIAMAIVAASTISPALAREFVVGDEKGWTKNFDYKAWAQGKEFHVGDQLVFKYPQGVHNVYRVNGTAFQMCAPPATVEPLTTGNDIITLTTTGKKWYICGVGSHCQSGNQKLAITVLQQVGTTAPAHSTASGIVLSKYFAWMIAASGVFMAIMV